MTLLPVEEALARIIKGVKPLPHERVTLKNALGRVLARPVKALRDQPPFAASAMDGYALKHEDLASLPAVLRVAGIAAAGHSYGTRVKRGEAVRIFTGAPVPMGADCVVIQENTEPCGGREVRIREGARIGQNIRERGLDFRKGEVLLPADMRLSPRDIALAAAANAAFLRVRRKPRVAILATGDELVAPGGKPKVDQIISSNSDGLAAMAQHFGAELVNLGIVRDDLMATQRAIGRAAKADILVTTGGASVGDHDFVQEALRLSGVKIDFWKIAMRPGKPFMYGRRGRQQVMGLPGNPVSALVCARLFLTPLLRALQGHSTAEVASEAKLGAAMKANDGRQDYVRARLEIAADGSRTAIPFPRQDSSMQRTFREANCLIIRPPHAPEAAAGTRVSILVLDY